MKLEFLVPTEKQGWNVRDFLRASGVSSTAIRAVKYEPNGIMRNGEKIHTNQNVNASDTIILNFLNEKDTSVIPQKIPLEIVYESKNVMVVNKPANMAIHPTLGYTDGTLANAFCGLMQARNTRMPFRAINRLDKNTSGLVLLALNSVSVNSLAKSVKKEYFAILQGALSSLKGVIDLPIMRCENSIITRKVDENGKQATTEYEFIACKNGVSLVKAVPVTGRTHQLRVHFSHIGCPLCGDDMYGGELSLISRHALHCGAITFTEPFTTDTIVCKVNLSDDMNDLLVKRQIVWHNCT